MLKSFEMNLPDACRSIGLLLACVA